MATTPWFCHSSSVIYQPLLKRQFGKPSDVFSLPALRLLFVSVNMVLIFTWYIQVSWFILFSVSSYIMKKQNKINQKKHHIDCIHVAWLFKCLFLMNKMNCVFSLYPPVCFIPEYGLLNSFRLNLVRTQTHTHAYIQLGRTCTFQHIIISFFSRVALIRLHQWYGAV